MRWPLPKPCPHCANHERTIAELRAKLTAIVKWLEANQQDVFKRGLWDAIAAAPSAGNGETTQGEGK